MKLSDIIKYIMKIMDLILKKFVLVVSEINQKALKVKI